MFTIGYYSYYDLHECVIAPTSHYIFLSSKDEPIVLPGGPSCNKSRDRSCLVCQHAISNADCENRGEIKRCNNPDVRTLS